MHGFIGNHVFELRLGCVQIRQTFIKVFGFRGRHKNGISYATIDSAKRWLQFLRRTRPGSPICVVANGTRYSVRLENSNFAVEPSVNFLLKGAEIVDGYVLFRLTHCDVTYDFEHCMFKWHIDDVADVDCSL